MLEREIEVKERKKERDFFPFWCAFLDVLVCVCDVHMCEQSLNGACGQVPVLFFSISIVYFFFFLRYILSLHPKLVIYEDWLAGKFFCSPLFLSHHLWGHRHMISNFTAIIL